MAVLPIDAEARKRVPLVSGVLKYFPDALCAVARLSQVGNEKHNPGEPLHWDRSKSTDHADCLMRHLLEAGSVDSDGQRHSAKVAWRALALLQLEIEAARVGQAREAFRAEGEEYLQRETPVSTHPAMAVALEMRD